MLLENMDIIGKSRNFGKRQNIGFFIQLPGFVSVNL